MPGSGVRTLVLVLSASLSLVGCNSLYDDDQWQRRIGVIDVGSSGQPLLQLPDTIALGAAITITITTYGSSSCTRADGARVRVEGLTAEIVPYDRVLVRGICTEDLAPFPRDVELQFAESGEALVRLSGRSAAGARAEIEGGLFVRP